MGFRGVGRAVVALVAMLLACAPAADAALPSCAEPGDGWPQASAASQGLDQGQLNLALHAYQDRRAETVRIFRNGCLVASDTGAANQHQPYEMWEMTSSVLGLVAAREMQMGLISPLDRVGGLIAAADRQHGSITVQDLLARTSGLAPRPDDIYVRDRLASALTSPFDADPGTKFGDSPLARTLLGEVLGRAAGEDVQSFAARELFAPLELRSWRWMRDRAGTTQGTFGLSMPAEDAARLAELVRRDGFWRGRRLLDAGYLHAALTPGPNPCYGWLVWLNAAKGCFGSSQRLLPGLPADLWEWRGRYDQRVTVLPSLGITVVRYGLAARDGRSASDDDTWEVGVLRLLLSAVRDTTPETSEGLGEHPPASGDAFDDQITSVFVPPPALPPRGRPVAFQFANRRLRARAGRKGLLGVHVTCPPVLLKSCSGTAWLEGLRAAPNTWSAPPGGSVNVMFRLRRRPAAPTPVTAHVLAEDDAGGIQRDLAFKALR